MKINKNLDNQNGGYKINYGNFLIFYDSTKISNKNNNLLNLLEERKELNRNIDFNILTNSIGNGWYLEKGSKFIKTLDPLKNPNNLSLENFPDKYKEILLNWVNLVSQKNRVIDTLFKFIIRLINNNNKDFIVDRIIMCNSTIGLLSKSYIKMIRYKFPYNDICLVYYNSKNISNNNLLRIIENRGMTSYELSRGSNIIFENNRIKLDFNDLKKAIGNGNGWYLKINSDRVKMFNNSNNTNTEMNRSFSGDSSLFSGVSTKENTMNISNILTNLNKGNSKEWYDIIRKDTDIFNDFVLTIANRLYTSKHFITDRIILFKKDLIDDHIQIIAKSNEEFQIINIQPKLNNISNNQSRRKNTSNNQSRRNNKSNNQFARI